VDSVASRPNQGLAVELADPLSVSRFSPSMPLSLSPGGLRLAGFANAAVSAIIAGDAMRSSGTAAALSGDLTALTPRDPQARQELAQNIQQQLRRVACYWGRIDGSWNSNTKGALKEFTDRVNATLPLDEPDYVQLALIQSQTDEICVACPAGQSLSSAGRCISPIRVASAQKEVLPWKKDAASDASEALRLFKPIPTTMVSVTTTGRMALGAPVPTSVDAQQNVAPITLAKAPPPVIAAVDINASEAKPQVTTQVKGRYHASRSRGRDRTYGRSRRFADAEPSQSNRRPQHMKGGTPRYNLLLSLGGTY
jgi:hypothetical protein